MTDLSNDEPGTSESLPGYQGAGDIGEATLLRITALAEGILIVLSLGWWTLARSAVSLVGGAEEVAIGIILAVLLLYLSFRLERCRFSQLDQFRSAFVLPICRVLSIRGALVVAIFSGVGEELFFRGLLQSEASRALGLVPGIFAVNLLFAYVHLLEMTRKFYGVFVLYFVAGAIFSGVTVATGSIVPAIVAHMIFNFLSILAIRKGTTREHLVIDPALKRNSHQEIL